MKLTKKEQKARSMVCLPLDGINFLREKDVPENETSIESRVKELHSVVGLFKIGKETFTRFGPESIKIVDDYDADVFLDLKYHDIPQTVKGAAEAASKLGVYMFNVHASGGLDMMKAALEGVENGVKKYGERKPLIVGVTVLTSIDENILNNQLKVYGKIEDQVLNLAQLANKAGLDGIVCSAADLYFVKSKLPENFMYITPGIQGIKTPAGDDQKRVFSPGNAVRDGSSILVIGRAITDAGNKYEMKDEKKVLVKKGKSEDRLQAGYEILQDMARYL